MTEPTPTTPSPIAVPWTPEMSSAPSTPYMQAPAQPQPKAYAANPVQTNPVHPVPQAQTHTQTQAQARPMPQPYQTEQQPQLHAPTPMPAQSSAPVATHPSQLQPTPYQGHMQPSVQRPPAPQAQSPQAVAPQRGPTQQAFHPQHQYHQQQQHQTPQQHQQHYAPQPPAAHALPQPSMAMQTLHAGPPPHAPEAHMQTAHMPAGYEEQPQSKSLLAGLLKRSPQPDAVATEMPAASTGRESLFNKNFFLGGLTGLVIGAFVLPIVLGMFGSDTPQPQARNFTQSSAAVTPTSNAPSTAEGGSFIDDAIASDAP